MNELAPPRSYMSEVRLRSTASRQLTAMAWRNKATTRKSSGSIAGNRRLSPKIAEFLRFSSWALLAGMGQATMSKQRCSAGGDCSISGRHTVPIAFPRRVARDSTGVRRLGAHSNWGTAPVRSGAQLECSWGRQVGNSIVVVTGAHGVVYAHSSIRSGKGP